MPDKITEEKLEKYFYEADKHKELLLETTDLLEKSLPIKTYQNLSKIEKFALNTLIFRFSKLQDLLGTKIFRNYLDFAGFEVSEKSFFDILKEIEKEGIVDIDSWDEFRKLRNNIAHEYPQEEEEIIENIELIIKSTNDLISVLEKIESKYHEIKSRRD